MFKISMFTTRVEKIAKFVIEKPVTSKTEPRIKVRFARFEPIRFPNRREIFLLLRAESESDNSGREVPIAIRVAPIKDSGISNSLAMFEAKTTEILELIITSPKPKQSNKRNFIKLAFHTNCFFKKLIFLFME